MNPVLDRRRPDDGVFNALSSPERRAMLEAMRQLGPMTREQLEALLPNHSHEAVGRHLNHLVESGLAVRRRVGGAHRVVYRRDNGALARALRRLGCRPTWEPRE